MSSDGAGSDSVAAAEVAPVRRLLIMPDSGREAVQALIDAAASSITLKIYTLTDPILLAALLRAQARGVAVRVMLNAERNDRSRDNDATRLALVGGGIEVRWGSSRHAATHEKSLVIDGQEALISSFNYAEKYFTDTRDYGIVTRDPAEVHEIVACFEADWNEHAFCPAADSRLLWAPGTSRRQVAALLGQARHCIHLQHAKLVDATVLLHLMEALERGVTVRFLCPGAKGLHAWDKPETFAALRILRNAGGKVRRLKTPKMHGNLTLVDDKVAQLGSLHFHHTAADFRRELSIEVDEPAIVSALAARFRQDWDAGERYVPPDPIAHGDTDPVDDEIFKV
ncbi:phospholipase D-like domain-containing protein [Rhizosaccharibacter radicis]|uniref:Phospholipase D n=1 Tax=Rhizosaccharibacter radicis TaxID=2782605 RepID=A0ABT1VYE6_9PROT|nr:phospholipase D-like domain-containing protein [Acetobacteraceae bacterium KSS12]